MTAWEKIAQKALVGSNLDSRQWNGIQAGLRDRAFFSSKVAEINILEAARRVSAEYAKGQTDLSKLRMELRDYLQRGGYTPEEGEEGTIKDLTTKARLDAIIKTNVAQARGFIQWADGQTPGAFAAEPCDEFVRIGRRKNPRQDWPQRWKAAGGRFYEGRMIAPKNSPVWVRLNKTFGTPYPPFDWGSGMGVLGVSRREALRLGVITDDEIRSEVAKLREKEKTQSLPSMNGNLQATLPFKNDKEWQDMKDAFGDQIQIDKTHGTVRWVDELFESNFDRGKNFSFRIGVAQNDLLKLVPNAPDYNGWKKGSLTVDQTWLDSKRDDGTDHRSHFEGYGNDAHPLKKNEFGIVASLWRNPHRAWLDTRERHKGRNGTQSLVLELDGFDGLTYRAVIDIGTEKPFLKTFFKYGKAPIESNVLTPPNTGRAKH